MSIILCCTVQRSYSVLVFLLQDPLRCYCVTVRLIAPPLCVDVLLAHFHHGINMPMSGKRIIQHFVFLQIL